MLERAVVDRRRIVAAALAAVTVGCSRKASPLQRLPAGSVVLALGDSIT
ncbi:MAG: arylesterase, partial [Microcoleus sp. SIO2G3]|nr:arylesterase [Microcoleus sp. SIO2G3]